MNNSEVRPNQVCEVGLSSQVRSDLCGVLGKNLWTIYIYGWKWIYG